MPDTYRFDSQVQIREPHRPLRTDWAVNDIKNEPMLFNCSEGAAHDLGGPITRDILANLPDDWNEAKVVVDTRVHMLMPGWFPCIPGFHHDDVARTHTFGQPNYDDMPYRSEHLMLLLGGDICPTEFALGLADFPKPAAGEIAYKLWHPIVESMLDHGHLSRWSAPSGQLIQFDWQTWHQGVRATGGGWRYFLRISRNTARVKSCTNERRQQVQVYLENPMEGW